MLHKTAEIICMSTVINMRAADQSSKTFVISVPAMPPHASNLALLGELRLLLGMDPAAADGWEKGEQFVS